MILQPNLDGLSDCCLVLRVLYRQLEQCRYLCIGRVEHLDVFCMCPEHGLIILVKAVCIFNCQLRLAHPTQATNSLRKCCRSPFLELSMQLGKQVFAPAEKEVSREWHIPERREIGSCKASRQ